MTPSLTEIPSLTSFRLKFHNSYELNRAIDWKILFLFLENNSQLTRLEFFSEQPMEMKENILYFITLIRLLKHLNTLIIPNQSLIDAPFYFAYQKCFTDRGELRDKINGKNQFIIEYLKSENDQSETSAINHGKRKREEID